MILKRVLLPLLAGPLFAPLLTNAETFEVKMLNRGAGGAMVYEPDHLRIAPGDTVRFLATHASHNAATLPSLWPAASETFKSPLNKPFEYLFKTPGLYAIQCIPHLAMGMVMLIQVGEPSSRPAIPSDLPTRARERLAIQAQRLETGH